MLAMLLAHGADVEAADDKGATTMHLAADQGHIQVAADTPTLKTTR